MPRASQFKIYRVTKLLRARGQKQIRIWHDGCVFYNITRWLPAVVQTAKGPVVVEDDFSSIIESLKHNKKAFTIRENSMKQRAVFVEETK